MYDQPPLSEAEPRLYLDFMRESACNIMKKLGPLSENWEFIGTGRDQSVPEADPLTSIFATDGQPTPEFLLCHCMSR